MSETQTLLLGFIAGVTILIGLPLGRVRSVKPGTRQFLNALAIGILIFLIWDVLVHAFEPVDNALGKLHDGSGGAGPVVGYAALFFLGISVGLCLYGVPLLGLFGGLIAVAVIVYLVDVRPAVRGTGPSR